ncbi:universal stress protein [Gracilinema caldarium]|uniref:UspA domain-containing protein n=1 Tax=Gracilinema caldarium (strain ATCC 51460 / DSM 7334 / H1) TaxID=744872 RepID=F8F103_GRAC1|nr:universal stress protein [Gracilinema caldarium]AEJ20289.1 UspA domain-containing protein [Gracilinema caldarium DSM 7334]
MFKTILVPLDGSKLAESALPIAVQLAQCCVSSLILFHGIEFRPPALIHGERHIQTRDEAEQYLQEVLSHLKMHVKKPTIPISYHIHEEAIQDIRQGIVEHIEELQPDLIVMSSHGKRGIKKAVVGSIPLQILKKGNIPILLIQSDEYVTENQPDHPVHNILLPLDSGSHHDGSLKAAVQLAKALQSELTLMTVIPTVGTQKPFNGISSLQLPISSRLSLEIETDEVTKHLNEHFKEIEGQLDPSVKVHIRVARGAVVKEIQKTAKTLDHCLMVLGTHGKIGMEAFWADSIAFRLASRVFTPILFIPL